MSFSVTVAAKNLAFDWPGNNSETSSDSSLTIRLSNYPFRSNNWASLPSANETRNYQTTKITIFTEKLQPVLCAGHSTAAINKRSAQFRRAFLSFRALAIFVRESAGGSLRFRDRRSSEDRLRATAVRLGRVGFEVFATLSVA